MPHRVSPHQCPLSRDGLRLQSETACWPADTVPYHGKLWDRPAAGEEASRLALLPRQQYLLHRLRPGAMGPGFCRYLFGTGSQLLNNAQTPFSLVLGSLPRMSTTFALVRDGRVGPPHAGGGFLNDSDVVKWEGDRARVPMCQRLCSALELFVLLLYSL